MNDMMKTLLIAAVTLTLSSCNLGDAGKADPVQTLQAHIVESQWKDTPEYVRATGTIHARESAVLSAQVMGTIAQILVREGDAVRAGQTLVALDDATLRASADQADAAVAAAHQQQAAVQTNADLAASTLVRYKQLQRQKSVTPQEMDEMTRRAESATAQVEASRAQGASAEAQARGAHALLRYTRIRAPFTGIVTARMVDPGALAAPGVPLVRIDSAGPLQLQATVDESAIGRIRTGLTIRVKLEGLPEDGVNGTIAQIVPAADPESHTFLIKVDLPLLKTLHAGMYGTAEVPGLSRRAVFVPESSIVQRGSLPCAYVLDRNGIAQLRYLTLGSKRDSLLEVLSGVSGGEKLVDAPGERDLAGRRIEAQP